MSVVLTSPSVIAPGGVVNLSLTGALEGLAKTGAVVAVVSNHSKPGWFQSVFPTQAVQFMHVRGRQGGKVVSNVASKYNVPPHDCIVLGITDTDAKMARDGGAVLLSAAWGAVSRAVDYGIPVSNVNEFLQAVTLVDRCAGAWYFEGSGPWYAVRALADASGRSVSAAQTAWAQKIENTINGGGSRLTALLATGAKSFFMSGIVKPSNLMFGIYPSSRSDNKDREVLGDFLHRLRTATSRVQFAKKGSPLLVRHTAAMKRSQSGTSNRSDPSEQLETVHLNPEYTGKVKGRHVVIMDDCTAYGVSFGVASALLRKAGAASVSCVALGKIGDRLQYLEIAITGNPFRPISSGQYSVLTTRPLQGKHDTAAHILLR